MNLGLFFDHKDRPEETILVTATISKELAGSAELRPTFLEVVVSGHLLTDYGLRLERDALPLEIERRGNVYEGRVTLRPSGLRYVTDGSDLAGEERVRFEGEFDDCDPSQACRRTVLVTVRRTSLYTYRVRVKAKTNVTSVNEAEPAFWFTAERL